MNHPRCLVRLATSGLLLAALASTANAVVDYTIRLVGPSGSRVPVQVLASGYADGVGYYNASAGITLSQGTQVLASLGVGVAAEHPDRGHRPLSQSQRFGP